MLDIDTVSKEHLKTLFTELFPHTDILIRVDSFMRSMLYVEVLSDYQIDFSFNKLIKIAEIFGTDKFDLKFNKDENTVALSDVTWDMEVTHEYIFSVDLTKVNTGVPWKVGELYV